MSRMINGLGRIDWNPFPSEPFMRKLSEFGWAILVIQKPIKLSDDSVRFGFYADGLRLDYPELTQEMQEAYLSYTSYGDDAGKDDELAVLEATTRNRSDPKDQDGFDDLLRVAHRDAAYKENLNSIELEEKAEYANDMGWDMNAFMSHLSNILKTEVSFFYWPDLNEIEFAFKPTEPIRSYDGILHSIAQKMSAQVRKMGK